jgi:hypothetical protein
MCELQKEAMPRNDEMPERRVTDRREIGAQFAADSHLRTVQAQQAIIAVLKGEITALTAEVEHLAAKLSSAQAVPVAGSVGDNSEFQRLLGEALAATNLDDHGKKARQVYEQLVAYIDSRATPASAPSGDRNSVLEEARAACQLMAEGSGRGEYREACNGCANAIQLLKYKGVPQPVAAAQAVTANEAELLAVMDKRDAYHETADLLAYAIAEHLNVGIGEHSSDNCPWRNALAAIAAAPPSPAAPKDAQGAVPKLSEAEILESLNTLSHEPPKRLPPGWINFARSIERKVHAKFAQPTDTTKGA